MKKNILERLKFEKRFVKKNIYKKIVQQRRLQRFQLFNMTFFVLEMHA